jgi:hypothetical protein
MSMKILGPAQQGFGLDTRDFAHKDAFKGSGGSSGQSGLVSFGGAAGAGGQVNFGGQPAALSDSRVAAAQAPADGNDSLSNQVRDLVQQILQLIAQMMQNNQSAPQNPSDGAGNGSSPGQSQKPVTNAAAQPPQTDQSAQPAGQTATPPTSTPQTATLQTAAAEPQTATADPATATPSTNSASSTAATGDNPVAGSGPRAFNITNTQDHPIKIGQFDQHDQLTAELTLQPGQTGTMKFENDTTGLLKQADADGKYKPDASRLEFYNGFINTSDIDGRNAAIHATDGKGFEVGDSQSVADKASSDIVSTDSAGNKTVAGFYDGSTDAMRKGGDFLTQTLGTGMTYMHPNDDTLGQGNNPMRHTDAMSLDVTFGKA